MTTKKWMAANHLYYLFIDKQIVGNFFWSHNYNDVTKMTTTISNLVLQISLNSETTFNKSIKLSNTPNTQPSASIL